MKLQRRLTLVNQMINPLGEGEQDNLHLLVAAIEASQGASLAEFRWRLRNRHKILTQPIGAGTHLLKRAHDKPEVQQSAEPEQPIVVEDAH